MVAGSAEPRHDLVERQLLALARLAVLELGLAGRETLGANHHLPGRADQVHVGELGPGPEVAIVVENLDTPGRKLVVDLLAGGRDGPVVRLEIEDRDPERSDRLGPDDAVLVVAGLDDGADQAR